MWRTNAPECIREQFERIFDISPDQFERGYGVRLEVLNLAHSTLRKLFEISEISPEKVRLGTSVTSELDIMITQVGSFRVDVTFTDESMDIYEEKENFECISTGYTVDPDILRVEKPADPAFLALKIKEALDRATA